MSKPTKSIQLLEKSIQAVISAIEIYNKPDFKYREEAFCILMTNAWEVLLKAKLLAENRNNIQIIYIKESVIKKDGKRGKKQEYKKNRCGNNVTIDMFKALNLLNSKYDAEINNACVSNLELLVEIRDNAIHFHNTDLEFTKKVLEVGTASLRSYITYVQQWFDYDLSKYNFYLMPISFFHSFELDSFSISRREKQMKRLLDYIKQKETEIDTDVSNPHNITLRFETHFVKSNEADAVEVRYTNNPNAPAIRVQEIDVIKNKYPLSYKRLTNKLRERYIDFKLTNQYHEIRKLLESNSKYCKTRLLDPDNPKSSHQKFYSPEIFKEFDRHYRKR